MDRIELEQMTLEGLAGSLNSISEELEDAASRLRKIDISRPAGGNLFTRLSSFRFSLLDLTLADEAVELVLKAIGVVASVAAGKTRDLRQRVQEVVSLMESTEGEVLALIDGAVCDPEGWQKREIAQQEQQLIDSIIADFDSVRPPNEQYAIQASDELRKKWYYQLAEGGYAFLTGDWENMAMSDDTRAQFLMESLLYTCTEGKVEPYTVEDLLEMGQDILTVIPGPALDIILEACGATKHGVTSDTLGPMVNLGAEVLNNIVSYVNQVRAVSAMDPVAALSMANTYMSSDNPCMQGVGQLVKNMVEGGTVNCAMILTGQLGEELLKDGVTTVAYDGAMFGLGLVASPLTYCIGVTGVATDALMNTGDAAQLSNNMAYASEMSRAAYSTFEQDYAAYKANPTQENLNKAMDSYNTYNRALAVSYESYGKFASNTTDSVIGNWTMDDTTKNADELADISAERCRYRVTRMQEYQTRMSQ